MNEIKSNLYKCEHCSGTCKNGKDSCSCAVCINENEVKRGKEYFGLPCAICNGLGQAEPKTERINKRITPILALIVVILLLFGVFATAMIESKYFSEILAFSGTLVGMILGFYYSSNRI